MTRDTAEILILTLNALGAGLLMFVAGVLQPMMDEMEPDEFRRFLNSLTHRAMTEPFAVTIATLPLIGAFAYFASYGWQRWWFTAGVALWMIGSGVTKVMNMPVYRWAGDPGDPDLALADRQRRRLRLGNRIRALLTLASVGLMACQFAPAGLAATCLAGLVLSIPLVWIGRRSIGR